MSKKIVLVLVLFFCLLPLNKAQAKTDWQIESFKSVIDIERDGSVNISETIKTRFNVKGKHGIYRDIPYRYQKDASRAIEIGLEINEITQDGQKVPYESSLNENYLRLKIGDKNKTIFGEVVYQIGYTATGVLLAYEKYDEFYWNVTGDKWEVPINQTQAIVNLPEEGILQTACYWGKQGSTDRCQTMINTSNRQATFFHQQILSQGQQMTIALGYVKSLVPIITAKEIDYPSGSSSISFNFKKALAATVISTIVFSALVYLIFYRRKYKLSRRFDKSKDLIDEGHRELSVKSRQTIIAQYEPPYNLRPGELGVVVDQFADTLDISATIVDLAVRGYLTITEEPKKWIFTSKDYTLKRTEKSEEGLLNYEKILLNRLFEEGKSIQLSKLKNHFYQDLAKVKEILYQHVTDKNFFFANPNKERGIFIVLAVILFVAGGVSLFGLLATGYLFGIGIAMELAGLLALLLAFRLPRRTALGEDAFKQALGYKLFVSGTEKYRQPFLEKENVFTEVLPYAIVFKVTDKLAKALSELGIEPSAPSWYVGAGAFNAAVFAQDMSSFASSISSVMASAPSSSGSGGGGSSGGGFGGGGGGSW